MCTVNRLLLLLPLTLASVIGQENPKAANPPAAVDSLPAIKRVCVDKITGEALVASASREILLANLFAGKRFMLMENCDKADATLKGAVLSATEKRVRGESESIGFGQAGGAARANRDSASAAFGASSGSNGESLFSSESRTQASVVLRLVDREGVVIWATTQESAGGKAKAAIPDALDRAVKQLFRDVDKASHSQ
jgi:hypothetical protein